MNDNSVALAALTLAGTIAGGFFALVNKQNKTHEKLANAMKEVASTNRVIADSNDGIAKELKHGNKQSEERNGHLGELITETQNATLAAIQNLPAQHVDKQVVDKQVVKGEK